MLFLRQLQKIFCEEKKERNFYQTLYFYYKLSINYFAFIRTH